MYFQKVATHSSSELLHGVVMSNMHQSYALVLFTSGPLFDIIVFLHTLVTEITGVLLLTVLCLKHSSYNQCSRNYILLSNVTMMVMLYLVKMDLTVVITYSSYYLTGRLVQGSENSSLGLISCFFPSQDEQFSVCKVYSLRSNVLSSVGV